MNVLPEKVSFQRKVLPAEGYIKTITKATELYQRAESRYSLAQIRQPTTIQDDRLNKLEEAVLQVSQQLTALSIPSRRPEPDRCFKCGRSGHLSRNCRTRNVINVEAEDTSPANAGLREMAEGVSQYAELGALSILSKCS